jgi:hypothetical protein
LLLTGALGYGAAVTSPPTYTARALVLLLPSEKTLKTNPNPLLALDGLELPGRVLVAYYASADARAAMNVVAPTAAIDVSIDDSTGGPVIAVDVTDGTPEATLKALNYVVDSIPGSLAKIQAKVGAPADSDVRSTPLVIDSKAQASRGTMIRTTIGAVGVGVVATGLIVFAVDGISLARRRRKAELAGASPEPNNGSGADGPDEHPAKDYSAEVVAPPSSGRPPASAGGVQRAKPLSQNLDETVFGDMSRGDARRGQPIGAE